MLRKEVKVKFYAMKLWMIHVVYLMKGNTHGTLCGSSSMGYYSHIALSVTYKFENVTYVKYLMHESSSNI